MDSRDPDPSTRRWRGDERTLGMPRRLVAMSPGRLALPGIVAGAVSGAMLSLIPAGVWDPRRSK